MAARKKTAGVAAGEREERVYFTPGEVARHKRLLAERSRDAEVLRGALDKLKSGYARDLVTDMLEATTACSQVDADSLFRTLVLDERWHVEDATRMYDAASAIVA